LFACECQVPGSAIALLSRRASALFSGCDFLTTRLQPTYTFKQLKRREKIIDARQEASSWHPNIAAAECEAL
jgi:hypothetical protein